MASTIGKAIMTVVPKLDSGADSKIESELSGIDAGGAGTKIGANLGKNLLKAFAAIGVATKVADTIRQSVESFAEYEQLVGGVETLFKGSADVVQQYAADAFKTAGLSANQYMETVTSFSASLLQSLGGDTAAAAEYANMAVTDMSDNANKMGTDMESIQNAYQGFAKQNFTMLDNLKLGYGGTKEEMQRLLEDAQKLSGIEYDISSYADIVDAIHVIQTEMDISGYSVDQLNEKLSSMSLTTDELQKVADDMGISYEEAYGKMVDGTLSASDAQILLGTTAKEAASTVQGSINSMKGAWENWLTALGGGGEIEQATQDLVDSVATVLENLIPVLGTILEKVIEALPDLVMQLAPVLLEAVWNLGNQILATLGEVLAQMLIAVAVGTYNVIAAIGSGISSAMSVVASIPGRILGVLSGIGTLLYESGRSLIEGFINGIKGAIDWAAETVSDVLSRVRDLFPFSPAKEGPFSGKGWTLYSGMAIAESIGEGFEKRIGETTSNIRQSMESLHGEINSAGSAASGGGAEYDMLVYAIRDAVAPLLDDGFDVNVDKREFGRMVRAYG